MLHSGAVCCTCSALTEIWGVPIRVFDLGIDKVLYERKREFFEK